MEISVGHEAGVGHEVVGSQPEARRPAPVEVVIAPNVPDTKPALPAACTMLLVMSSTSEEQAEHTKPSEPGPLRSMVLFITRVPRTGPYKPVPRVTTPSMLAAAPVTRLYASSLSNDSGLVAALPSSTNVWLSDAMFR